MTMTRRFSLLTCAAATLFLMASPAQSQLYWDGSDTTASADGGDGTWDVAITSNWDNAATGGASVAWPVTGSAAVLGGTAGNVDVTGAGIFVTDLTVSPGVGTYGIRSLVDGGGVVVNGSATWNVNDNRLNFVNLNDANDTALFMPTGGTLTVTGSGVFDTGERPGEAPWGVQTATLDFQAADLRGNAVSVGNFANVIMADGSSYIHERNAGQNYANNWQLNGEVEFKNRFFRNFTLNGVVSGNGTLVVTQMGNATGSEFMQLANAGNTFSGGVIVDSTLSPSELQIGPDAGDAGFGAVPATIDPDNITLRSFGELKAFGIAINANRGITLEDGGIIVSSAAPNTVNGPITGTGGLQIGRNKGGDANRLVLTNPNNDYTGGTRVFKGALELGIDNAIPKAVLTVGGINGTGSSARVYTQGFDLEISGLRTVGNQTRLIENEAGTDSTLTIDVPAGESYSYNSNIDDRINNIDNGTVDDGTVNFVKEGEGVQVFGRTGVYNSWYGNVTVNGGRMRFVSPNAFDSNNDSILDIVGNNGPRITTNANGVLVLNVGDVENNLQWESADLDEVLDNATFNPGSRLGLNTSSGDFVYASNISGVQGIEKVGGNTLTLTGTNSYSGQTVVDINADAGVLLINGNNSGATGDVLVQNGTLGGVGTIGGNITVEAGAAIAPGAVDSIGTLTLNGTSLAMAANVPQGEDPTLVSEMNFQLNGGNTTVGSGINDLLDGVGSLTLDGVLNVSESPASSFSTASLNDSWRLINYSGSLTDGGLQLGTVPTLGSGLAFRIDTSTAGQINLQVAAASLINGDFNNDGLFDCTDINALSLAISGASGDLNFDMNGDGQLTIADITDTNAGWLAVAGLENSDVTGGAAHFLGDLDLDGNVNSIDLGLLLNNFSDDTGLPYCSGNLNADMLVNSIDLGQLLNNFGMTQSLSAAVPEPSAAMLLMMGALLLIRRRRRS